MNVGRLPIDGLVDGDTERSKWTQADGWSTSGPRPAPVMPPGSVGGLVVGNSATADGQLRVTWTRADGWSAQAAKRTYSQVGTVTGVAVCSVHLTRVALAVNSGEADRQRDTD